MRVFLAVPADAGWVDSARRLVDRLRTDSPNASWTRPESWHVTLKFLGETSEDDAERFADAFGEAAARAPGGSLAPGGALLLPHSGRPRVLGVGFASDSSALAALGSLARAAESAFRGLGGAAEDRPFHPHVTLARLRSPWPRPAVDAYRRAADEWAFPAWPVRTCVLYRSRLASSGAVHVPLREWALAPAAEAVRA